MWITQYLQFLYFAEEVEDLLSVLRSATYRNILVKNIESI